MNKPNNDTQVQNDLKGINQLSQDGIIGVVDLVEAMHQRIYTLGGLLNSKNKDKTNGLTGFIYNTIRRTTALSIQGIDLALATFKPLNFSLIDQKQRNQWVSILNGVLGDHLAATDNPLAIEMTFRHQGQDITPQQAADLCQQNNTKPLLLIHGLCMNDHLWTRQSHNHGVELAQQIPSTVLYIQYNSGLAIDQNGELLAKLISTFIESLPEDINCDVMCHSMGGLVIRSAIQKEQQISVTWVKRIDKLVLLGTPHHGARLEQSGGLVDYLLTISPYSAPFAKLTGVRSQGIKDLRQGRISQSDSMNPISDSIKTYAIAGSRSLAVNSELHANVKGDGLVSVTSALGLHTNKDKELNIPTDHQFIVSETNHMHLLSSPFVFEILQQIFTTTE